MMTAVGYDLIEPDISDIVTEDDTPVDNIASEKQQRLLTEPLYTSWEGPPPLEGASRPFVATANVGLFSSVSEPPLVPDVLLSVDVRVHPDFWEKKHRSYFIWEFGKAPEVVIEVVSNREGGELSTKKRRYAKMRVAYYVVWDPARELSDVRLQAFELRGDLYVAIQDVCFESIGLELGVWNGSYEGVKGDWLRWRLPNGSWVLSGAERAEQEKQRAEQEKQRAEQEKQRAEQEKQRAEQEKQRAESAEARAKFLLDKLRAAGIDPNAC